MAIRPFPLGQQVDGINLMRQKGGASPSALFDLKNGWVTSKRTVKARPGTVAMPDLPAGTKGCVGFEAKIHTFSHAPVTGTVDPLYVVHVLRHPTGGTAALAKVHRAFPFLGRLYVVAEFADGVVRHYWIEDPAARAASRVYPYGATVQPAVKNGFYYEMLTKDTTAAWQENVEITVGAKRQPKVSNGLRYTATSVTGTAPIRTGNTEPLWPTTEGATVVERRFITEPQKRTGTDTTTGGTSTGTGGSSGSEYGPFPPGGGDTHLK